MMFPCERCGWMPEDCPCAANRVTTEEIARRHTVATARVNAPIPLPVRPAVLSPWLRGDGKRVAHRFRDDNGRSVCGLTTAERHHRDKIEPTADEAERCAKCQRTLGALARELAA